MSFYGPKIEISGYITSEPTITWTSDGKLIYSFSVNDTPIKNKELEYQDPERYLGRQLWFDVQASGERAEYLQNQGYHKGQLVKVQGRLYIKNTTWTDKNGARHNGSQMKIRFPEVTYIPKENPQNSPAPAQTAPATPPQAPATQQIPAGQAGQAAQAAAQAQAWGQPNTQPAQNQAQTAGQAPQPQHQQPMNQQAPQPQGQQSMSQQANQQNQWTQNQGRW